MSLDAAINSKKEHRSQYFGSQKVSKSCRPHGGCPWCESNRKYSTLKRKSAQDYDNELFQEEYTPSWNGD